MFDWVVWIRLVDSKWASLTYQESPKREQLDPLLFLANRALPVFVQNVLKVPNLLKNRVSIWSETRLCENLRFVWFQTGVGGGGGGPARNYETRTNKDWLVPRAIHFFILGEESGFYKGGFLVAFSLVFHLIMVGF